MIPKVIHYCWFGNNELPPLAKKCIASWRKFLPDYEIFKNASFSFTTICERMQESAFLIKGVTIEVIDEESGRRNK